jgi:hypothetical protein
MNADEKELDRFEFKGNLTDDQKFLMETFRKEGKKLVEKILSGVPNSADRNAGIRCIRLGIMQINAAIVNDWPRIEDFEGC